MSVSGGPSLNTSGLALELDMANLKSYYYTENLISNSSNPGSGYNLTVVTNAAAAPDGTQTALQFVENTANTTHTKTFTSTISANSMYVPYTASIYVKSNTRTCFAMDIKEYGTFSQQAYAHFDVANNTVLTTYVGGGAVINNAYITPDSNGWSRLVLTTTLNSAQTSIGFETFVMANTSYASTPYNFTYTGDGVSNLYVWGPQLQQNSNVTSYTATTGTAIQKPNSNSLITPNSFIFSNTAYYVYNSSNGTVQFTRTAGTPKDGGGMYTTTLSGLLTCSNFLYNDHTWEVWTRIDDITAGNYDGTEGLSSLVNYSGYHAGFQYNGSNMYYTIWEGLTAKTCAQWTLGTTNASQIVQGNWYQIVVTRQSNVFTPYLNGVQVGTGSTQPTLTAAGSPTANTNLWIGRVGYANAGAGSYQYYPKNTFSNMKMYTRALSPDEVLQNFISLRGRFGL